MKYEETPFHIKNSLEKENGDNCNWRTIKSQKKSLEKGRKIYKYLQVECDWYYPHSTSKRSNLVNCDWIILVPFSKLILTWKENYCIQNHPQR